MIQYFKFKGCSYFIPRGGDFSGEACTMCMVLVNLEYDDVKVNIGFQYRFLVFYFLGS